MTTATLPAPSAETSVPQLLDAAMEKAISNLDSIATVYTVAIHNPALGRLSKAMVVAQGIDKLRAAIDGNVMNRLMSLMNSQLGFKTDRPNKSNGTPYSPAEVKDAIIAGLLRGVYPVNNEINIISGQLYIAQEGYRRLLRETEGLSDLRLSPGVPVVHNGQVVVRFGASWKYFGKPDSLMDAEGKPGRTFAIITTQYSTPDATVGKATRKALKAIYEQIHGSQHSDDEDTIDVPAVASELATKAVENKTTRTEQVQQKLAGANGSSKAPSEEQPAPPEEVQTPPDQEEMAKDDLANALVEEIKEAKSESDFAI